MYLDFKAALRYRFFRSRRSLSFLPSPPSPCSAVTMSPMSCFELESNHHSQLVRRTSYRIKKSWSALGELNNCLIACSRTLVKPAMMISLDNSGAEAEMNMVPLPVSVSSSTSSGDGGSSLLMYFYLFNGYC
jgi:hypothetical protein